MDVFNVLICLYSFVHNYIIIVSQFTLLAKTSKGSKPDFHKAMNGQSAKEFYFDFLNNLKSSYEHDKIKDGAFGEMMDVSLGKLQMFFVNIIHQFIVVS